MRFEEYHAVGSDDNDDNGDDSGYDSGDDNNGDDSGYMTQYRGDVNNNKEVLVTRIGMMMM